MLEHFRPFARKAFLKFTLRPILCVLTIVVLLPLCHLSLHSEPQPYFSIIHDLAIPELEWDSASPGHLTAKLTGASPKSVKIWHADNPKARDFRVDTIGRNWVSKEVLPTDDSGFNYSVQIDSPEKGWRAFMFEFTFRHPKSPAPLKMTTGVYVIPDTLPHLDNEGSL